MYWSEDLSTILKKLHTDTRLGLERNQVETSLRKHGQNVLAKEQKHSQLRLFIKQFNNTLTYMLLLAALVSLLLNEHINSVAIFAILFLNGLVGFIQESKAEASIEALKSLSTPKAKVIRDGKISLIESKDIVPGDLLTLEAGDFIVADARIVEGFQLSADESVLTGESMPVEKDSGVLPPETVLAEQSNVLHAGTAVTTGSARAVVMNTGMNTEIGKIAGLLNKTETESTP
jgi:Ca2+-transporting ATPase